MNTPVIRSTQRAQTSTELQHNRMAEWFFCNATGKIRIVIRNRLLDPDSDADHHQNVTSWSLGHTPALHKVSSKSSKSIGIYSHFFNNSVNSDSQISDFELLDRDSNPDRHQTLITWSLVHSLPLQEISSKSIHNFFSYPTDRQTNRPKWK